MVRIWFGYAVLLSCDAVTGLCVTALKRRFASSPPLYYLAMFSSSPNRNIFFDINNRHLISLQPHRQKALFAGKSFFPVRWELQQSLKGHDGCVNSVAWVSRMVFGALYSDL